MSKQNMRRARRRVRSTPQLSIASVFALAQISRWGLFAWQPRTADRPPFAILANPGRTTIHSRTLTLLLEANMVKTVDDTLVLTDLGRRTVEEYSDLGSTPARDEIN